jgi:peptide-methionine (S)-S-oxide reductase
MFFVDPRKIRVPAPADALPGRDQAMRVPKRHFVLDAPLATVDPAHGGPATDAFPGLARVTFGMGCFWGAERKLWQAPGVRSTAVGYAGGFTKNPSYEEVCSGETGHTEVVLVVFDPAATSFEALLKLFWESHDPTQGMRQGNDVGTQYRSAVYCFSDEQQRQAEASRDAYQERLAASGFEPISTEIGPTGAFYYAEEYHQQYLGKNPNGYCGLGGTGVSCPIGLNA